MSRVGAHKTVLRRILKFLGVSCVLTFVVLVVFLITIHIPAIQRTAFDQFMTGQAETLGFKIEVDTIHFNLFSGTLNAEHIQMVPVQSDHPARFILDSLHTDINIKDAINNHYHLENIQVRFPQVIAAMDEDGNLLWPWNPQGTVAENADQPDMNPEQPASPFELTVDQASLFSGTFQIVHKTHNNMILDTSGIELTGNLDFRSMQMNADLTVETARWTRAENQDKTLKLLKPLKLTARRNGGPINVEADTDLESYPLHIIGQITPEQSPIDYNMRVSGNGSIQDILDFFDVQDVSVPSINIETMVESTGKPVPDLTIHATAENAVISQQMVKSITLIGDIDQGNLSCELSAGLTHDGSLNLKSTARGMTQNDTWSHDLYLKQLPLDLLNPWLPETYKLGGSVDGSVSASGIPAQWKETRASGKLVFVSGRPEPVAGYPVGTIQFDCHNKMITLNQLDLADADTHIMGTGYWNTENGEFQTRINLDSGNLSPWLAIADQQGRGSGIIEGQFHGNTENPVATLKGEFTASIIDLSLADTSSVSSTINGQVENNQFTIDVTEFKRDEITAQGSVTGQLAPGKDGVQTISARIDPLSWRNEPTRKLQLTWRKEQRRQQLTASTFTGDAQIQMQKNTGDKTPWTGTVDLDAFDVKTLASFLPSPWNSLSGTISARVQLNQQIQMDLTGLDLNLLNRHLSLPGASRIQHDNGLITVSNYVVLADDGTRLAINGTWDIQNSQPGNLQLQASTPDLANWTIPGSPENLSGSLSTTLQIQGVWPEITPSGTLSATGLNLPGTHIGGLLLNMSRGDKADTLQLTFAVDALQPENTPLKIDSNGTINLMNALRNPESLIVETHLAALTASLDSLQWNTADAVDVTYQNGRVTVRDLNLTGPDFSLKLQGSLPVDAENASERDRLDLKMTTRLEPFEVLNDEIDDLNGAVTTELSIAGHMLKPLITGQVQLSDIDLDSPLLPGPLQGLGGVVNITHDAVRLSGVSVDFAGGPVEITGGAERDGMGVSNVNISMTAREINLDYTSDLQLDGSADLWLRGVWPSVKIGGTVLIREALYSPEFDLMGLLTHLPEQRLIIEETDGGDDDGVIDSFNGLPLELTVVAHEGVRIENSHMDLDLAARLQIIGSTKLPGILGAVTLNQGIIDLLLHEFEITGGTVNFSQPYDLNPALDISARTGLQDEVVMLRITGHADRPNLLLSSESGKSQAEIMEMLLGNEVLGGSEDLATMAEDYATQAAAMAAAKAISARTDLIIVPFPDTLDGEDLLFGVGKKLGDRWTVMYYIGEKSDQGDVVEVELQLSPKSEIRVRQNQDDTISGGFRYRETFN